MENRKLLLLILLSCIFSEQAVAKPCWVFFTDRGELDIEKEVAAKIASPLEPKNRSRRARIFGRGQLFDEMDVPVNPAYISVVTGISGSIRTVTRFLNGVSVELDEEAVERIRALTFVREVRPVAVYTRTLHPVLPERAKFERAEKFADLSYGNSFEQLNVIGVTQLHKYGYMGSGITIAVLDSGFDNLGHAAFDSIMVAHRWDFVEADSDPVGDSHGSEVLSIMAALDRGQMIGAVPYATYLLARTEIVELDKELRVEEDYWVSGIEWADSLGADIVHSSLGYTTFDDGSGYTYADLDGDTAVTTIVADAAVAKGMVVVTSAGNEGNKEWYYVTTPADGDSVIAVGAIDTEGVVAPLSSRGPTYDGRTKPDFMALGENVWVVDTATQNSYKYGGGTSYAAPAVSGAAALLLETNPLWMPLDVYEALRITAVDRGIAGPDSLYGHGIINAIEASGIEPPPPVVSGFKVYDPYPQPITFDLSTNKLYFPIDIPVDGRTLTIKIFTFTGENVKTLEKQYLNSGSFLDPNIDTPSWDGTNFSGENVAPGIYYYMVRLFGYDAYTGKIAVMR